MTVGALEDEFGLELNRPRLGMYPLNAGICEPLTRLTDGLHAEPWLATRSEYRGDNTYRLTLRRGVSFHDGSEFNAKAAKYALGHSVRVKTQYSFLSEESVRVIDDSTVEIRPTLPNLRVIDQLVHPLYGMIAPGSNPVPARYAPVPSDLWSTCPRATSRLPGTTLIGATRRGFNG